MSDEIQNTDHNHINLDNINEHSECHHHNHNHIDNEVETEKISEGTSIITFAIGDDKHPIDEEDEVKLNFIILMKDYRVYWRKNKGFGKFRKM